MNNPCANPFTVIEGGKAELERKKQLLFNQPWIFSCDEFEQLCEQFEVPRAEAFDLQLMCIQHKAKANDEAAAVFAVMSGTKKASEAIAQLRRNRFRLETSVPPSLPRSSRPNDEADV
jgi:hypothetical protein